jgi:polyphosphate kinase
MQSDGTYSQRMPAAGDDPRGSQEILVDLAQNRARAAGRKKLQGRAGRRRLRA